MACLMHPSASFRESKTPAPALSTAPPNSATSLLMELHWLPVRQRIAFKLLLITYKSLNQMAPIYLSDLIFIAQAGCYNLRSSNRGLLLAHPRIRSKKTLTDRSFMLAAPNLWNKLPAEIRSSPTLNIFKSRLKTHLFTLAFY